MQKYILVCYMIFDYLCHNVLQIFLDYFVQGDPFRME